VVFPARVFHVKSRVSCGLIPLLVVVYSPSFITLRSEELKKDAITVCLATNKKGIKNKEW
jgi:hypothetical protein